VDEENTSVRFPKIFNLAFLTVLGITVVSFLLLTILYPLLFTVPLSALEERALRICDWGFKSGLGAIAGLLTGKFAP